MIDYQFKVPIKILRSASLLLLWDIIEKANQDHILRLLKICGISDHKLRNAIRRVSNRIGPTYED